MNSPQAAADTAPLVIEPLTDAAAPAWDAFVQAHPEASFFHLSAWRRILEQAFGQPTHFLQAKRGDQLVGILPLAHQRSLLFGNALIALPFCVYGGIVASDAEAHTQLLAAAKQLAERLQVDHLELRNRRAPEPDLPVKDLYYTFRKAIAADDDANLKAIPRKQRAMVRKGINAGLHAEPDPHIERFFHAYASSVRNLGTPVFPKHYFTLLRQAFPANSEILTITHDGQTVASVLSFFFRDEVLAYYGGGTEAARALKGNDFMYWSVMQRAAAAGYRLFDYGRSKQGTGSFDFKKNWGFEPEPLYYQYYLVKADKIPDINPLNPKYRLFINAWQRLPLAIANRLGPLLARRLG